MIQNKKLLIGALTVGILILLVLGGWWVWYSGSERQLPKESQGEQIAFSSGCSDILDFPGSLDESEKERECVKILNLQYADLKNMGYEPVNCQFTEAKGVKCGGGRLGTTLTCTYSCKKDLKPLSKEIVVVTDITNYIKGETVNIRIENNLDEDQWMHKPFFTVERFDGNKWLEINREPTECGKHQIVDHTLLLAGEFTWHRWFQEEKECKDSELVSAQVPTGRYRIKTYISNVNEYTPKEIYSKEFTIKEK